MDKRLCFIKKKKKKGNEKGNNNKINYNQTNNN